MTEVGSRRTAGAVRSTRQRAAIAALLADIDEFRSAQELHDELRRRGEGIGLTTVYRTLQAMSAAGQVDTLRTDTGESLYRRCSAQHHHHLVCRRCGAVADVDCAVGAAPCLDPGDTGGFEVDEAEVVFWGTCAACRAAGRLASSEPCATASSD